MERKNQRNADRQRTQMRERERDRETGKQADKNREIENISKTELLHQNKQNTKTRTTPTSPSPISKQVSSQRSTIQLS